MREKTLTKFSMLRRCCAHVAGAPLILLTLVTLAGLGLLVVTRLTAHDPTFQGKSARYWMYYNYRPPRPDLEFQQVWTGLGSNAVPFLVLSLAKKDPPAPHFSYRAFRSGLPQWLKNLAPLASPPARVVRSRAAAALGVIGKASRPAIPALIDVMQSDESASVREAAKDAINKIEKETAVDPR